MKSQANGDVVHHLRLQSIIVILGSWDLAPANAAHFSVLDFSMNVACLCSPFLDFITKLKKKIVNYYYSAVDLFTGIWQCWQLVVT